MVNCVVCGDPSEQVYHHFPNRKSPYNQPYFATLYHQVPSSGVGGIEEYCGPKCSTAAFIKARSEKQQL